MLNHKSKSKTRNAAIWLSDREVWLVAGISPALLSPHVFPFITALALAVIPLLSLLRRAAGRPWMKRTPLNAPFLLLLISVPASLLSSPTSEAAQTSACVLLLGIALFMAAVNSYQPDRKPLWIGGVATLLGLSIALAYFASGTVVNKLTVLDGIAAQVSGISSIVQTGSVSQMDPSMVAGVLALLLPVVSAFALVALRRGRIPMQSQWYLVATIILGIGAVILVALFSTQVRTAIFAVLILMLGTAATRWRGIEALVIALGVVVVIMLLMGLFTGNLSDWMHSIDALGRSDPDQANAWEVRVEIWRNAIQAMRDYPITGVGFGAYSTVTWLNYPYRFVHPASDIPHPMNLWLQTGTESGISAFLAFMWMTLILGLLGWALRRLLRGDERTLMTGVWLGLLAWMAHGILHALPLSTYPGVLVWLMMGYLMGSWSSRQSYEIEQRPRDVVSLSVVLAMVMISLILVITGSSVWKMNQTATQLDRLRFQSEGSGGISVENQIFTQLEVMPTIPSTESRLIAVKVMQGDDIGASNHVSPESIPYVVSRVQRFLAMDDTNEAKRWALIGLRNELSGKLQCLMARACDQAGDKFCANRAWRLFPSETDSFLNDADDLARCYHELGQVEESFEDWDRAQRWYQEAMISAPDDHSYVPDYARVLFISSGDHREPVAILEQAINRWPHQSTLYHGLIEVLLAAERPQKAASTAQDAVELEPDNVESWLWLARSWIALDNQTEAERVAEEILRLDPNNEEALAIIKEQ